MNENFRFYGKLHQNDMTPHPESRREKYILAGISILSAIGLLVFFRFLSPFVFETNDDLFLRMIASGEMSGTPEAHLHFISYPAGLLLSLLYRLFPSLPWYGLFLCSPFLLTETFVLSFLLRQIRSPAARFLAVALFGIVSCAFLFPHLASLQFTTSAGIAAAGALFLFSVSSPAVSFRETLKNHAGFFLLAACAFCIRDQVLYMSFPFIGVIWLSKYLDARKLPDSLSKSKKIISENRCLFLPLPRQNSRQKNLLKLALMFFSMLTSFLLIEKLAYRDSGWSSFRAYSAARASVYDYEGYPDYDAFESVYQELGISRSSYEGAAHRYSLLLDPAINRHSMEVLKSISSQDRGISLRQLQEKLSDMAEFFVERHLSDADRPLNLLVYRCYLSFVICSLLSRKWRAFRDILFLCSARMAVWSYLIYHGRVPIRVSQTVYLAELAVLFAVALGYRLWLPDVSPQSKETARDPRDPGQDRHLWQNICCSVWSLSLLFLLFTCLRSGVPNAKKTAEESIARLQFSESFVHMKEYFSDRPDCFYYLDTNSFAYFTEDALEPVATEDSNYLFMGGWAAKSPWYDKKLKRAGILDPAAALYEDPSVYAVFMDTDGTDYGYLEDFYAENYPSVSLRITETIDAGGGISFLILKGFPEETP